MKPIKRLALALCWALSLPVYSNAQTAAELDPTQVYNTGNVAATTTTTSGSTWVNGVYQNDLTCWAWGDPGYCGPNPIVRPGGNINYSFGWVDLYQTRQIADILPYSGTGLKINGYNFSFTAKNGNGWDDGRTDSLFAYVQFDGPQGTVLNNTANLSFQYNWTNWTLAQTFANPYSTLDVTSVRYGFVGQDNNGWAGPYGPEIMNVSFSLNYSVDPCVSDPLFSPTCPGYLEALARLIPATDPVVESTTGTETPQAEPTPVSTVSAAPSNNESSPTADPAVAAAPEQKQDQNQDKKGASLSTILGIVGREQSRIAAVEQGVVAESVSQALKDAEKTTAEAEAVAQQSSNQSQEQVTGDPSSAAQASTSQSDTQSVSMGSSVSAASLAARSGPAASSTDSAADLPTAVATEMSAPPPQSIAQIDSLPSASAGAIEVRGPVTAPTIADVPDFASSSGDTYLGRGLVIDLPVMPVIISVESVIADPKIDPGVLAPSSVQDTTVIAPVLMPKLDAVTDIDVPVPSTLPVATTTAADDWLDPRVVIPDTQNTNSASETRRHSATNDLAQGIDIAGLATQPQGYAQYNMALQDVPFYAPKEIYKGQKVVDNARALRQLSSDARHQEMVEQQYKR